jgi:uncharacterized protein YjdB
MRSPVGSLAGRTRAGAALLLALVSAGTAGCSAEFWTGRPTVKSVDVSVAPKVIAEGQSAQANGIPRKDDGSQISSSKVRVTYASSDPNIATVSATSGTVTAVSPGRVAIIGSAIGSAQGKTGADTIQVVAASPSIIVITPNDNIPMTVGASTTFTVDPRGPNGQTLPNRTATLSSDDSRVATVVSTGPLSGRITAVALGTTQINATVGSVTKTIQVIVRQAPPGSVTVALQTGKSEIQVKESQQVVPTVRDSAGNALSTFGRAIVYQSSDVTVASVNNSTGVVTGLKEGTTELIVTVDNLATGKFTLRVIPQKVVDLKFPTTNYTFRVGGTTRNLAASPLDSTLTRVDRPVAYKSLNEAVASVTNLGLITPRGLGSTRIIASIDNLTDTLAVQVTPLPIASVVISPRTAEVNVGQTRQFTATLFDSLGTEVSGRPIEWLTTNVAVASVTATGLATAAAPGTAQIQAVVEEVPGLPKVVASAGQIVVRQTPIARLQVQPDSVNVRLGGNATVVVRAFDANGNELFGRGSSIVPRSANTAVALASVPAATTAASTITGLAEGKTTITFQAVDTATGLAQGAPATVTVVVASISGGGS